MSTHSAKQAIENIEAIRTTLAKCLPGGDKNIKSIYIKSTNSPALPIYSDETGNANEVDLPNNMSSAKIKRSKLMAKKEKLKRLGGKRKSAAVATKKVKKSTKKN